MVLGWSSVGTSFEKSKSKMACKFLALAALAAVATCEVAVAPVKVSEATNDPLPQYSFGYDVQDALTGDSKSQIETRNGNVVRGQYSLNDPDGTRRIVDYTADPVNGFNAVVRRAPLLAAPAARGVPVNPAIEPLAEPVPSKVVAAKSAAVEAVPVAQPVAARVAPAVERVVAPAPAAAYVSAPVLEAAPLVFSQGYSVSRFGPIAYTLV